MSDIKDFKDLRIWQKGVDIAEKCYLPSAEGTGNRQWGTVKI
jgi:hypothetical protein